MKLFSSIFKSLNTPNDILLKKIKKKIQKKKNLDNVAYLSLDNYKLKNNLFKIEQPFFSDFKIDIENLAFHSFKNEFKIFSNEFISVSDNNDKGYNKINWQKDQLSGFEWDVNTKSKDIIFGIGKDEKNENLRKYIGAEIKFPWELGRQQDLVNLAICYIVSDELKDETKEFFKKRIYDFSENNPISFGTQWQTSMDIAIRAVNYLISYDILKSNGCNFDTQFENHFSQLILSHYLYIYDNLEFSDGLRGNHYFANLMGLIIIYSYLDLDSLSSNENSEINDIFYFALNSFFEEILYQFYNDGGNFEASVPYHYFTTEMLLLTLYFIDKIPEINCEYLKISENSESIEFRSDIRNRILNIIEFSINLLIGENIPNIGDNDSGLILDLMPYQSKKYNLILLLDKFNFDRKDIEFRDIHSIINQLLFKCQSYFLADKFGISRSSNKYFDLVCFAGNKGQNGKGGHSHNDKCSFELYFKSKKFIVDLGSAFYTSNWNKRNYYRSVCQHNVLHNGTEQDLFLTNERDDLFWLYGNKTKAKIVSANNELVILKHFAYKKEYERELILTQSGLKGIDKLNSKGKKIISFHFHNDVLIEKNNKLILRILDEEFEFITNEMYEVKKAIYSPEYGIEFETKKIELISNKNKINWEIKLIEH